MQGETEIFHKFFFLRSGRVILIGNRSIDKIANQYNYVRAGRPARASAIALAVGAAVLLLLVLLVLLALLILLVLLVILIILIRHFLFLL